MDSINSLPDYVAMQVEYQVVVEKINCCGEINELLRLKEDVINRPYLIHLYFLKKEELLRKAQLTLTF